MPNKIIYVSNIIFMSNPEIDLALLTIRGGTTPPCHAFYAEEVKTKGSLFEKTKIVVLADQCIAFVKNNGKKVEKQYSWFDFKSYKYENEQLEMIIGSTTYSLLVPETSELPSKIEDVLQMILTPAELNIINNTLKSKPTPKSAFFRASTKNPKISNEISHIIRFGKDKVTLTQENLTAFIAIIPLLTSVTCITIKLPLTSEQIKDLNYFLSLDTKTQHLHFNGQVPAEFNEIMKTLSINIHSSISSLAFTNSNLSEKNLQSLLTLINAQSIKSIGFHGEFAQQYVSFFDNFLPSLSKQPRFINLSHTTGVNLRPIYSDRLVVLSLESTGIEISTIFESISLNHKQLTSLRMINVSYNTCNNRVDHNMTLPSGIRSVFADFIQWKGFHMRSFFELLFNNFTTQIKLSFKHQSAPKGDWQQITDLFSVTSFTNFAGLNWSGNPVNLSFISFLSRNRGLTYLDVSDCFSDSRPNEIKLLGNFLEAANSLKVLIMRGNQAAKIGKMFGFVLQAAIRNQIPIIDLAFNYGGDEAYKQLELTTKNVEFPVKINFDGAHPTKPQVILDYINCIYKDSNSKVRMSFPKSDLELFCGKSLPKVEYKNVMKMFAIMNSTTAYDHNPFHVPYTIFHMKLKEEFPEFISNENIGQLLRTNPTSIRPSAVIERQPINTSTKTPHFSVDTMLFTMSPKTNDAKRGRSTSPNVDKAEQRYSQRSNSFKPGERIVLDLNNEPEPEPSEEQVPLFRSRSRSLFPDDKPKPFVINIEETKPKHHRIHSDVRSKTPPRSPRSESRSTTPSRSPRHESRSQTPPRSPRNESRSLTPPRSPRNESKNNSFVKSEVKNNSFVKNNKSDVRSKTPPKEEIKNNKNDTRMKTPPKEVIRHRSKRRHTFDVEDFEEKAVIQKKDELNMTLSDGERLKESIRKETDELFKEIKATQLRKKKKKVAPKVMTMDPVEPVKRRSQSERKKRRNIIEEKSDVSVKVDVAVEAKPKKKRRSPAKTMIPDEPQTPEIPVKKKIKKRKIPQTLQGDDVDINFDFENEQTPPKVAKERRSQSVKRRRVHKNIFVGKNEDELMEEACDSLLDEYVPKFLTKTDQNENNKDISKVRSPLRDIKPISLVSSGDIVYDDKKKKKKKKVDSKWKFPAIQIYPPNPSIWDNLDSEFSLKKMVEELKDSPKKGSQRRY